MGWDAPICVGSAAFADGEWIGAAEIGGAAECVCRNAKARGISLRESRRRDATSGLRNGEMARASHYGINLQASPEQRVGAPNSSDCPGLGPGDRTPG